MFMIDDKNTQIFIVFIINHKHSVRRSYNTLTEVGRPHDMDNNHILAIIEQKI
jgi:hypothetical protein